MKKQIFYNNRLILFVIALLFSLTPCKVKASLLESFGITYEQTLNQSKVTSNCNSSCFITQKVIGAKSNSVATPSFTSLSTYFLTKRELVEKQVFNKVISVQFPPKYILYKQFKFDMV